MTDSNIKNPTSNTMLGGENSENSEILHEKTNYTNYSNLTNYTNYSNLTSLLGLPQDKAEKVYFLLFCEPDCSLKRVLEVSGYSTNAFYNFKSRDKNILSRKVGKGNEVMYSLLPEMKEQIELRIKQKLSQKHREAEFKIKQTNILNEETDILLEIKSILDEKTITSFDGGFIFLNLQELQELNPVFFERLIENPETVTYLWDVALSEKGLCNKKIRFSNYEECLTSRSIDSLRSKDLDKIHLIECRSSILSDVRPQITLIKFECPSCGTIISIAQLDKTIKEPSRCSCGRRGGFKELSNDKIDRARVELEDLQDLTETPNIKSIQGFVYEPLTSSKELSNLYPGNEIKVLGILKSADRGIHGKKSTALDIYLHILEVQPFEQKIDLDQYTEEDKQKIHELAKVINETNSLQPLERSFAPEIIESELMKRCLILKAAQGRRRKNKSNVLFASPPGKAKSILMKKYHSLIPGSKYVSGAGSSAVGLTATAEKKDDGWILKPGVLVTTREDAIIDEFNLVGAEEIPKLQEAMSEGELTINKASIHAKLRAECGIIAGANPINGDFNNYEPLIKQLNIPLAIFNRFDVVLVIRDYVDEKSDRKIASQMIKRENGTITQQYSDEFLKKFFVYIREQPEPKFPIALQEDYIPSKYSELRQDNKQKTNKTLVNSRFVEAITRLSKSMSKLKLKKEVSYQEVDFSLELLKECLKSGELQ